MTTGLGKNREKFRAKPCRLITRSLDAARAKTLERRLSIFPDLSGATAVVRQSRCCS